MNRSNTKPGLSNRMGPPVDSVQLPYRWLNSMVYGRYNYSQWMVMGFINELITGEHHPEGVFNLRGTH